MIRLRYYNVKRKRFKRKKITWDSTFAVQNISLTEGSISSDTVNGTININVSVAEGSKSGDVKRGFLTYTPTTSDGSISGDEKVDFSNNFFDTVTEGAKSSDTLIGPSNFNLTVPSDTVYSGEQFTPTVIGLVPFSHEKIVESQLNIIQEILGYRVFTKTVEHELEVEQENIRNTNYDKEIEHNLETDLTQTITYSRVYNQSIIDDLSGDLEQTIEQTPKQQTINHTLTVTQTISNSESILQVYELVEHDLSNDLIQTITYSHNTTKFVEHIVPNQQIIMVEVYRSGSYVGYYDDGATPTVIDPTATYVPTSPTIINDDAQGTVTVLPNVGVPDEPEIVETSTLTLSYPVVSPTSTVVLRAPLFGNREEIQVTRIQRITLDHDLKIFVDSNWPKVRTFRYQFEGITDSVLDNFNTFLLLSLGLEIKIIDHEGLSWKGFIINPELDQTQQSSDTCHNTLGFEFIGVKL